MIPRFRAWDKQQKSWTNYAIVDDSQRFYDKHTGCWKTDNQNERFALMQSTGLKDKNGVEICEGDIVKPLGFARWIGVVKYATDKAAFVLKDHDNEFLRDEPVYLSQFVDSFEILGNIYENPDLMEG